MKIPRLYSKVYIVNMFISKYEKGNIFNHDERRQRELLLHKKEINKVAGKVTVVRRVQWSNA